MTRSGLDVLVVERERAVSAAIAAALQRRGHSVATATSAEDALRLRIPEVVVCAVELDGMDGLDLLETLRHRGHAGRVVLMASLPNLDDCRRAMRLGAAEFLAKPLDESQLLPAIEAADPRGQVPAAGRIPRAAPSRLRCTFCAVVEEAELAVRDLTAELVRWGLGPTARVRIATAAVELLDNVIRHAYPVSGADDEPLPVELEAECDGREVRICVRDEGIGFDVELVRADALRDPVSSGLTRAETLCEHMEVRSTLGAGTEAELRFSATRSAFDERGAIDLTELDWLTPGMCRRVLEILQHEPANGTFNLSPAVAVTVGRLLSGPVPATDDSAALRS